MSLYFLRNSYFYLCPGAAPANVLDYGFLQKENKNVLDMYYSSDLVSGVYTKATSFVLIDGYVTVESVPAKRQVWLFEWYNKIVVRSTWSDPLTGYYKFDDIKAGSYFVWSEDYQNVYRPQSTLEIFEGTYNLNFSSVSGSYNQYIEDPFDFTLTLFSGIAKYNNNEPVSSVSLLSESGTFITSVIPDSVGAYSFYVKKGNKYVIVFVGNGIYRPEAYFYQAPN